LTILTPEQKARVHIDSLLTEAGWQVQTRSQMNRTAASGVAVCEFPLTTGEVDYLLFAGGRPIGVVEAKAEGTPLSGVEPQARNYAQGLPDRLRPTAWHDPLPFRYVSTGIETFFADDRDPNARSRRLFTFHRPETLISWAQQQNTLGMRLRQMPELHPGNLWPVQIEAIHNLERSLGEDRPRALIQMATGNGKRLHDGLMIGSYPTSVNRAGIDPQYKYMFLSAVYLRNFLSGLPEWKCPDERCHVG